MSEKILLKNIDKMLNNIAQKLILNDDLMKCLQYKTSDALSQSITTEQKNLLINQEGDITDTRIFFQPFNDKVITDVRSELRIYYNLIRPDNATLTKVHIGFDVVVNNNIWRLDDGLQRPMKITKSIFESLNGQAIGGIGTLLFYGDSSIILRYFNDSFTGYFFSLRNWST